MFKFGLSIKRISQINPITILQLILRDWMSLQWISYAETCWSCFGLKGAVPAAGKNIAAVSVAWIVLPRWH